MGTFFLLPFCAACPDRSGGHTVVGWRVTIVTRARCSKGTADCVKTPLVGIDKRYIWYYLSSVTPPYVVLLIQQQTIIRTV